ncbi:hypothetical protein EDB83DRAFT_2381521 [Lactarius deliciosus]|nr:hypothetical protein EDB83DRAFT_2381521 [Lactarius deliciosus]
MACSAALGGPNDALEAQGVAALGARRKMLKTFEVVLRKMGINDPTAPPPPAPSSGGPTAGKPGSTMGDSASGGLPSASYKTEKWVSLCLFALCPPFTSSVSGLVISKFYLIYFREKYRDGPLSFRMGDGDGAFP